MGIDEEPRTVRDLWLMIRTVAFIGAGVLAAGAGVIAHFVHEERQDAAIQSVRDWQAQKDREARGDRWRKDRGFSPGIAPPVAPGPT